MLAKTQHNPNTRIVVVGGGIAGLSTAWYLRCYADENNMPVEITVLEASANWGGKVKTTRVDNGTAQPYIFEAGADAFLTRKPWAYDLALELGLEAEMQAVNTLPERIYILKNGALHPMPKGLYLLVPTNRCALWRSPLFSLWGKVRMLAEQYLPAKNSQHDESIYNFVVRRFGKEAADTLAEPLLAGVYNADIRQQSILATFAQYRRMEAEHGSLIKAMTRNAKPQQSASVAKPSFISFKNGTATIIDALIAKLDAHLCLRTPATRITADDNHYQVQTSAGMLDADFIVMAAPANVIAAQLAELAPAAAKPLASIRHEGVGTISLVFKADAVVRKLDAYGVVIPGHEGCQIDGMTWTTSKWDSRAPSGEIVIRVFFGGPSTRDMLQKDDDELLQIVRAELRSILELHAEPLYVDIQRWHNAYPQYDVGHLDRVAAVEQHLPQKIYVAGSALYGIGVPDCVHSAQQTASRIIANITEREHVDTK